MTAAVLEGPNTDFHFEERDRPTPARGEVLVRVRACARGEALKEMHEGRIRGRAVLVMQ